MHALYSHAYDMSVVFVEFFVPHLFMNYEVIYVAYPIMQSPQHINYSELIGLCLASVLLLDIVKKCCHEFILFSSQLVSHKDPFFPQALVMCFLFELHTPDRQWSGFVIAKNLKVWV